MTILSAPPSLVISLSKLLITQRRRLQAFEEFEKLQFSMKNVKVDLSHLHNYQKLCSIEKSNQLPVLYPHIMAAKLHMYLFSDKRFPINLLGAIHKYNVIECKDSLSANDLYEIQVEITNEKYFSKGVEFDVETKLLLDNKVVWKEVSTYLKKQHFDINLIVENSFIKPCNEVSKLNQWYIPSSFAKKYAILSSDFNPIHISKLMAKFFGFESFMAHGMSTAAQSLAKINNEFLHKKIKIYFKGPCILNKEVSLHQDLHDKNRYDLICQGNDRPVICLAIEDLNN